MEIAVQPDTAAIKPVPKLTSEDRKDVQPPVSHWQDVAVLTSILEPDTVLADVKDFAFMATEPLLRSMLEIEIGAVHGLECAPQLPCAVGLQRHNCDDRARLVACFSGKVPLFLERALDESVLARPLPSWDEGRDQQYRESYLSPCLAINHSSQSDVGDVLPRNHVASGVAEPRGQTEHSLALGARRRSDAHHKRL